ncbi:MAG: SpoIID/LytB domain-containing protein [Vicinamibacterales bacterium]
MRALSVCMPALAAIAALMSACSTTPSRAHLPAITGQFPRALRVQVAEQGNAVRKVPLEEYVQGAIISEFAPPNGDVALVEQMFEVQAIVSRTYAIGSPGRHSKEGFDLCSTTHCQLYEPSRLKSSRWAAPAMEAVSRTAGVVLWHGKAPALAIFSADCGGYTNTPVNAWAGTARPYLTAAADDGVQAPAHAAWHYEVPAAEMVRILNTDTRTRIGSRLDAIRVVDRDQSGRAQTVALSGQSGKLVHGEMLRTVLARELGARAVRSALFEVRREHNVFLFEGRGFGHGVGLCQAGALSRLRGGATPEAVLQRYFPTTVLRSLYN